MMIDLGHFIEEFDVVFAIPRLIEVELLVKIVLFDKGKDGYTPTQKWVSISICDSSWRKLPVGRFIVQKREHDLLEVIHGGHPSGRLAGRLDGRQQ